MYTIEAHFEKFNDIRLSEMLCKVGVYVIWDSRAVSKPTYIGEGQILKRFNQHCKRDSSRFSHPWDGYVAIIGGSTPSVHKYESLAVERLLLDVARDNDRLPRANKKRGSLTAVEHYCTQETLRVAVSGWDPLLPPKEARPLTQTKEIKVVNDPYQICGYRITVANWSLRKLRY